MTTDGKDIPGVITHDGGQVWEQGTVTSDYKSTLEAGTPPPLYLEVNTASVRPHRQHEAGDRTLRGTDEECSRPRVAQPPLSSGPGDLAVTEADIGTVSLFQSLIRLCTLLSHWRTGMGGSL